MSIRTSFPTGPARARAALLAVALLLAACGQQVETPVPQVRPVRAIKVAQRALAEPVVLTGRIEAEDEVALAFRIGGRLMERPVAMGQRVEPGQLVARLEPQNELNALRTAEANLAAAQGQLDEARSEYGRQRHLEERGWAARAVYERALQALQTAQARVDAAEAQLKLARDQVSFTELKADAPGVVIAVAAEPGVVGPSDWAPELSDEWRVTSAELQELVAANFPIDTGRQGIAGTLDRPGMANVAAKLPAKDERRSLLRDEMPRRRFEEERSMEERGRGPDDDARRRDRRHEFGDREALSACHGSIPFLPAASASERSRRVHSLALVATSSGYPPIQV